MRRHLLIIVSLLPALYLLYLFAHRLAPQLGFGFDIDPTDGDVLNSVVRLREFKPIYLNWYEGKSNMPYAPLYAVFLAAFAGTFGDTLVFARWVNLICFALALGWAYFFVYKSTRHTRAFFAGAAVTLVLLNTPVYEWLVNVRTDAFALLCVTSYIGVRLLWPECAFAAGWLAMMAPFCKQSFLTIPVALALETVVFNRKLIPYALAGMAAAFLAIVPVFEWHSGGRFLLDVFIMPAKTTVADFLSWEHMYRQFSLAYDGKVYVFALGLAGALWTLRRRPRQASMALVFLFDGAFLLKTGRNVGGGSWYYWLNFLLACVFTVSFVAEFPSWVPERYRLVFSRSLAAALFCFAFFNSHESWDRSHREYELWERQVQQETQDGENVLKLVGAVNQAAPGATWFTSRASTPVVKNGITMETDGGSYGTVFAGGAAFDPRSFLRTFVDGRVQFVFHWSGWEDYPRLYQLINYCYEKIWEGPYWVLHTRLPVYIMKYAGTSEACQRERELLQSASTP